MKVCYILFTGIAVFLFPQFAKSQVLPAEGSNLHYRLIGFSFPASEHTDNYKLEIAQGTYNSEDSFSNNIIRTVDDKKNKIIAEVPLFGKNYTWQAVYIKNQRTISKSALFHFSTGMNSSADTNLFRFTVVDTAQKYKDAYVFIDDDKTLYDMKGQPVWFMPDIEGRKITPRDIKLSPQGTITFLFDPPYEINYNGAVLWKGPQKAVVSGDYTEHFNHEFTRLSNGHYMVLGDDSAVWEYPILATKGSLNTGINNEGDSFKPKKMQFGTLIEYDEKGNVVWSWKSSGYFANSDLRYYTPPNGQKYIDVHVNSFYFDEKNKNIYVSFKNTSGIVKVKYPEGTVTNAYGESYKPGGEKIAGLFCGQHAVKHSERGYLYLYNNNACDSTGLPNILVMEEPGSKSKNLKTIWKYDCTADGIGNGARRNNDYKTGGNVVELPDQSMFVCMSSASFNKLFIVNRDKEILWSAIVKKWNSSEKKWVAAYQYRASIISRDDLERLIWNASPEPPASPMLQSY